MTPDELRAWRKAYFLSRAQLSDILGINVRTVARWEDGGTPPPSWLPIALESITGQRAQLARKLAQRKAVARAARRRAAS